MSDTPNDDPADQDADAVDPVDPAQPEDQRGGGRASSDDAPSAADLDEREANRSSHRKAAGPGGGRGADRAARAAPSAQPERRPNNPETRVEP